MDITIIKSQGQEKSGISTALLLLGVSPKRNGYQQLVYAVALYRADPYQLLSKELYPAVAISCGNNNGQQVERTIRTAIKAAWQCRDDKLWQMFFPVDENGEVPKPTNGYFIARLARLMDVWDVGSE